MEFSDRKLSPDPSRSDGSSVEFVAEMPGPDWEDDPWTIVLSDNEEGLPKPKKKMLTFIPDCRSPDVLLHMVASHCCSLGEHESGYFSKEHPC